MGALNPDVVALVAEDEPVLAGFLVASLRELWPALSVRCVASDGESALEHLFAVRPEVAFLDIRMPGLTGLEVARRATESWDVGTHGPLPIFVFVTAHDEHAIEAFELAAFDYLTKPIGTARLAKTVARLQAALAGARGTDVEHVVQRLETVLGRVAGRVGGAKPLLETIRASTGNTVRLIGIDDVVLFEAAGKYVSVVSTGGEASIREALTSLAAQLDDRRFVRLGRSRIVNLRFVTHTERGDDGRVRLALVDRERRYPVSRAYAHRFRAM